MCLIVSHYNDMISGSIAYLTSGSTSGAMRRSAPMLHSIFSAHLLCGCIKCGLEMISESNRKQCFTSGSIPTTESSSVISSVKLNCHRI